jgi:hypothetical protein
MIGYMIMKVAQSLYIRRCVADGTYRAIVDRSGLAHLDYRWQLTFGKAVQMLPSQMAFQPSMILVDSVRMSVIDRRLAELNRQFAL